MSTSTRTKANRRKLQQKRQETDYSSLFALIAGTLLVAGTGYLLLVKHKSNKKENKIVSESPRQPEMAIGVPEKALGSAAAAGAIILAFSEYGKRENEEPHHGLPPPPIPPRRRRRKTQVPRPIQERIYRHQPPAREAPRRYKTLPIIGDGNCFYRSIASLQYGDQHKWPKVKESLRKFARSGNSEVVENAKEANQYDLLWKLLNTPNSWAQGPVIALTSERYSRPIRVIDSSGRKVNGPQMEGLSNPEWIIMWKGRNHYEPVIIY